jgi:hypothetical protein
MRCLVLPHACPRQSIGFPICILVMAAHATLQELNPTQSILRAQCCVKSRRGSGMLLVFRFRDRREMTTGRNKNRGSQCDLLEIRIVSSFRVKVWPSLLASHDRCLVSNKLGRRVARSSHDSTLIDRYNHSFYLPGASRFKIRMGLSLFRPGCCKPCPVLSCPRVKHRLSR